jgi:broad-specificity NMP kinase
MGDIVIDSNHFVNIMRIYATELSEDEKNSFWKKHKVFENTIGKISDIIKECSITNISSLENNYTINLKKKR